MITVEEITLGDQYLDDHGSLSREEKCTFLNKRVELDQITYGGGKDLLRNAITDLLANYNIYFVYSEGVKAKKSKIRSFKKLFYNQLKTDNLPSKDVFQVEYDVNDKESVLTGLIKANFQNLDYLLEELLTGHLRFIYFVKKGKRSFKPNKTKFLSNLITNSLQKGRVDLMNRKNLSKLVLGGQHGLIKRGFTGGDSEIIEFITRKENREIQNEVEQIVNRFLQSRLN